MNKNNFQLPTCDFQLRAVSKPFLIVLLTFEGYNTTNTSPSPLNNVQNREVSSA